MSGMYLNSPEDEGLRQADRAGGDSEGGFSGVDTSIHLGSGDSNSVSDLIQRKEVTPFQGYENKSSFCGLLP
jgi:hypothetical protein